MSSDGHTTLIKTPRQLITVVVLAFLAPVILIILLATFVTSDKGGGTGSDAMTPEAIAERLRPIGSVVLASASTGPRSLQSGEAVYKLACSACHATGAAGAPMAPLQGYPQMPQMGFPMGYGYAMPGYPQPMPGYGYGMPGGYPMGMPMMPQYPMQQQPNPAQSRPLSDRTCGSSGI